MGQWYQRRIQDVVVFLGRMQGEGCWVKIPVVAFLGRTLVVADCFEQGARASRCTQVWNGTKQSMRAVETLHISCIVRSFTRGFPQSGSAQIDLLECVQNV